jgi:hypothetical protein
VLVVGLLGLGIIAGALLGALARGSWRTTLLVEALGFASWAAFAIYAGLIYDCPEKTNRECNPEFWSFLGLFALAGWAVGAVAPLIITRVRRTR